MRYVLFLLQLIWPRRFYLTRYMTKLKGRGNDIYWRVVGMTFSQLFFCNISLLNQHKYIPFDIFSCRILIISYKMSIITGIFNETRNELSIYAILCLNVTIFYRKELTSLFQVHEKLKTYRSSRLNFSSCCLQMTVM